MPKRLGRDLEHGRSGPPRDLHRLVVGPRIDHQDFVDALPLERRQKLTQVSLPVLDRNDGRRRGAAHRSLRDSSRLMDVGLQRTIVRSRSWRDLTLAIERAPG